MTHLPPISADRNFRWVVRWQLDEAPDANPAASRFNPSALDPVDSLPVRVEAEPMDNHEETSGSVSNLKLAYWLTVFCLILSPPVAMIYMADQHLRHVAEIPTDNPWDFNGDGSFTISDLAIWWARLSAYPAHDLLITYFPRPSHFLELDRVASTGFWQSSFGIGLWAYFGWLSSYMAVSALAFLTSKFPDGWRVKMPGAATA